MEKSDWIDGENTKLCGEWNQKITILKQRWEVRLHWNNKQDTDITVVLTPMSLVPLCIFVYLLVNCRCTVWDTPSLILRHLSNLTKGRLTCPPTPFISPLSGSPGAGHCCDITVGGRGPYHQSNLKCRWEAFNILLIKIAECSTIIHSH